MYEKSFIDACLDGSANINDFQAYMDHWLYHRMEKNMREFLGFTECEYDAWIKHNEKFLQRIIECRKNGIPFENSEPDTERKYGAETFMSMVQDFIFDHELDGSLEIIGEPYYDPEQVSEIDTGIRLDAQDEEYRYTLWGGKDGNVYIESNMTPCLNREQRNEKLRMDNTESQPPKKGRTR